MPSLLMVGGEPTPAAPPFRLAALHPSAEKPVVRLKCPVCRHDGTLEPSSIQDVTDGSFAPPDLTYFGLRRCPNIECHAAIFVVCDRNGSVVASYPREVIDFDATGLPDNVLSAIEEAINCHSVGGYRAAAIMVRRALEEVCAHFKVAEGSLYDRIEALSGNAPLPSGFLTGLHDLRLLGNDAAHLELKDFDDVGQEGRKSRST